MPDYHPPSDVKDVRQWIYEEENAWSEISIKDMPKSTHGSWVEDDKYGTIFLCNARGRSEERRWALKALRGLDPEGLKIRNRDIKHWGRFKSSREGKPRIFAVSFYHIDQAQDLLRQSQLVGLDEKFVKSKSEWQRNQDRKRSAAYGSGRGIRGGKNGGIGVKRSQTVVGSSYDKYVSSATTLGAAIAGSAPPAVSATPSKELSDTVGRILGSQCHWTSNLASKPTSDLTLTSK